MDYIKPSEGAYLKHINGNILLYGKQNAICTINTSAKKFRGKEINEHGNYDKGAYYILATPEEIDWVNKCMELDRYIPFKDINIELQYEIY